MKLLHRLILRVKYSWVLAVFGRRPLIRLVKNPPATPRSTRTLFRVIASTRPRFASSVSCPCRYRGVVRTSQDRLWASCAMETTDGQPISGGRVHGPCWRRQGQILGTLIPTPGVPPPIQLGVPSAALYTRRRMNDPVIPVARAYYGNVSYATVLSPC